jgi:hypothetical protein
MRLLIISVVFFLFTQAVLPVVPSPEPSTPVRPAIVLTGCHSLTKSGFHVINSQGEENALFADAFPLENPFLLSSVDYSHYSAIWVFHPKDALLGSLSLVSVKASKDCIDIHYSKNYITQVFIGVNDDVANAPYLFLLVPKWKKPVLFHQEGVRSRQ